MNTPKSGKEKNGTQKKGLLITHGSSTPPESFNDAIAQIDLTDEAIEALDRIISLGEDDVLVCETTCLNYAAHALSLENGPKEVWLVAPLIDGFMPRNDLLVDYEDALYEQHGKLLNSMEQQHYDRFKLLTDSVPDEPFKLLITTKCSKSIATSALHWPELNPFWIEMLNTKGATGAIIYPSAYDEGKDFIPSLREGNLNPGVFIQAVELPGECIVLRHGKPGEKLIMEDLTDSSNPWAQEVSLLTLVANDGCMIPSMYRTGIEVLEETTLGSLATRISRGTTVSEKNLAIVERLDARVVEPKTITRVDGRTYRQMFGTAGSLFVERDRWAGAEEDDLYYVDGSCFNNGEIWPILLESIPKGQERYIVDQHDGEVLLISRNSKQPAVYKALRPTLIANSVFIIWLDSNINRDYLACWIRGFFARRWLHGEGKILSKGTLESLPVPILSEETMKNVVQREHSIRERILDLREEIERLEWSNRFAPLAANREQASRRHDEEQSI